MRVLRTTSICLLLGACDEQGDWVVETWGEEYIEQGIPADVFADGCSAVFEEFVVSMASVELRDGGGATVGDLGDPITNDVVVPGPTPLGAVTVPADHYSSVWVVVAPTTGSAVLVDGTLTCAGDSAHFRWTFDEHTQYQCEPEELTIPSGGTDETQLTIHGDHLFYDGLENPDAAVRGTEILAADANGDDEITLEELDAVSIPALGFEVGQYSDVLTLRQFVSHLTRTIVHVDGEGECRVDF
jgi:hypothetical protein